MNVSILVLGSAFMVGADPYVTVNGSCCGGGVVVTAAGPMVYYPMASCGPCGPRAGIFQRLRARLASLRPTRDACAPVCEPACAPVSCAPACGTPVFTGFTTSCADPCDRVGLLARLRAKFHGSRSCDVCTAPQVAASVSCGGCAPAAPVGCAPAVGVIATPAVTTPATPTTMPAPIEPKKEEPKKEEPKKQVSADVPGIPMPMPTAPISVLR